MQLLILVLSAAAMMSAGFVPVCCGHNITRILAEHPEFSTFNHYLTETHLAGEIDRRLTITVLAVDNAAMAPLLAKHLPLYTLKNVLSLHVLVDYFGAKKLHQLTGGNALSSSLFQSTGDASGVFGFVNISDHRAGHVLFTPSDPSSDSAPAAFVKSIKEIPYNLSVIQINSVLSSPSAEAPTPAPAQVNLTDLMAKKGCKHFADLLLSTSDAAATFQSNVNGGLTVFCPIDQAMAAFMPKFKNLTLDGKTSLLLYHGVPVYNSIQMLKSNNGVANTLATDGASKKFNFTVQNDGEVVTLKTRVTTAKITGTLIDEDPLAMYTIDQVLEPSELFKKAESPSPAPAPASAADAPKGSGKAAKHKSPPTPAGPDAAPDSAPADNVEADNSGARMVLAGWWAAGALMVVFV